MCFDSVVVRAACLGIHALDGTLVDRIKLRAKMAAAVSPVNATAAVACIYPICCSGQTGLKLDSAFCTLVQLLHAVAADNVAGKCLRFT